MKIEFLEDKFAESNSSRKSLIAERVLENLDVFWRKEVKRVKNPGRIENLDTPDK